MTQDHVVMQVPLTARSGPLVRLAAAQLAAQGGASYEQVEDVRIAIGETVRILCGVALGQDSDGEGGAPMLDADFAVGVDALAVTLGVDPMQPVSPPGDDATRILETTTMEYEIDMEGPTPQWVALRFDLTGQA